jgi:hypothetical protein
MDPLWLLAGDYDAPGWRELERDAKAGAVDLLMFDRLAWALVRAPEPPVVYRGLAPAEPPDGLYLDPHGRPLYLVGGREAAGAEEVIAALGAPAAALLATVDDPDTVLERLGRVY